MSGLERHWYRLTPVSLALLPLALLFCAVAMLRRALYRSGLLASTKLPVPVIIVGNITVGGTGKTPLVLWLVQMLRTHGWHPGIITRGYRGRSRHWPIVVTPSTMVHEAGDEAMLLAHRAGCPIVAGPDRIADARRLLELGCNIIVSDDGLQHYRLRRDLEIAVLDGVRRLGNRLCLPAGPLREPAARLRSVTLRISNGEPQAGESGMRLVPAGFYNLANPTQRVEAGFFGRGPVHAVAGIGNPERFFATLRTLGLDVIPHPFPDHHVFHPEDLRFDDDRPVIVTEKDAVKCQDFAQPRHWALAVTAQLDDALDTKILKLLEEKSLGQETA